MIIDLNTNFGYKCPSCFEFHSRKLSVFEIPKRDGLYIKCKCNDSNAHIYLKGSDYVVKTPCFICAQVHTYRISKAKFWSSDILVKECLVSSLDVCALGNEQSVKRWIKTYSDVLKIMTEEDFE